MCVFYGFILFLQKKKTKNGKMIMCCNAPKAHETWDTYSCRQVNLVKNKRKNPEGIVKPKKVNAVLALLSIVAMILHIGYNIFSYLKMYYNPAMKMLTSIPFIVLACMHAVLAMCLVFLLGDGTQACFYPAQNRQTVIQRISATLVFPLLIVHLRTFEYLKALSEGKNWTVFVLVILVQIVFYAVSITHVAVSFPKALVTLGVLDSREKLNVTERISFMIGVVLFIASVYAVIRGEIAIFIP